MHSQAGISRQESFLKALFHPTLSLRLYRMVPEVMEVLAKSFTGF
jgi:hypothetical protein